MSDFEKEYGQHFTSGLKVTVCVPMENNEVFRDWSVVESLEKDLLTLSLLRERYSGVVHLVNGITVDLRIGVKDERYRCSGVLVRVEHSGMIKVHLTGSVTVAEPREYYRIDVFIPYRYELSKEQSLDVLIEKWRQKRQKMHERSAARRAALASTYPTRLIGTALDQSDPTGRRPLARFRQEALDNSDVDESWNRVNACLINLSAGGFKFVTADDFQIDELVFIELFIPVSPPRIVVTLARVVYKTENDIIKEEKKHYNIAVHFVLIDDGDMDAIVSHIFKMDALQMRRKPQPPVALPKTKNRRMSDLTIIVLILVLAIFIVSLYFYMSNHDLRDHIEGIFENALKRYRSR